LKKENSLGLIPVLGISGAQAKHALADACSEQRRRNTVFSVRKLKLFWDSRFMTLVSIHKAMRRNSCLEALRKDESAAGMTQKILNPICKFILNIRQVKERALFS
jgi:hypothetical protein